MGAVGWAKRDPPSNGRSASCPSSRASCCWDWPRGPGASSLLALDARLSDQLRIARKLLACRGAQLLGARAAHGEPLVLELRAHFGILQGLHHFGMQPGDDVLR